MAVVGAETKVDGGGCARALRRCEVEERRRGKGRKGKGPSALFTRRRDKRQAQESRSPKKWICPRAVSSIFGGSLIKVRYIQFFNEQVMSWRFIIILEDDVMAVYYNHGR